MIIKWNKTALKQFDKAVDFIERESPLNAERVKQKILLKISSLSQHPEKYYPDKYKIEVV